MVTSPRERRYGGKTTAERRAERRVKLLDAGLELFGDRGYVSTTIESLCTAAGLNARYFYEEFDGRENLLRAIYDRHVETVWNAVLVAVAAAPPAPVARLSAGLAAFVDHTLADPRAARINYFEMVGVSPALEARRREVLAQYAAMIAAQLEQLLPAGADAPGGDLHRAAVALVSATDGLIIDALSDGARSPLGAEDRDQIVTTLSAIFSAFLPEAPE